MSNSSAFRSRSRIVVNHFQASRRHLVKLILAQLSAHQAAERHRTEDSEWNASNPGSTPKSDEFRHNRDADGSASVKQLRDEIERVRLGGPEQSARERHLERGKLLVRDRDQASCSIPAAPFLELSPLAAYGMYDDEAPGAGIVTGIGRVHGREAVMVANDATVKGGTYYPITVKKHLRAQEIALQNRAAVRLPGRFGRRVPAAAGRGLSRSRALRAHLLQSGADVGRRHRAGRGGDGLVHGGRRLRAGDVRREHHRASEQGTIFLAGPPLVRAATGEEVTAEELGGGDVHTRLSRRERSSGRRRRARARRSRARSSRTSAPRTGLESIQDAARGSLLRSRARLYGIIPADTRKPYDVREVIARLVDGSRMHEFKPRYGTTLVTGFARIYGYPVGIIANNGVLFSESALKATHFIELCCARRIPLLFLQNITGFIVGKRYEQGGIAKDGAKMVNAVANAQVPKFTVIIGASNGAGNYGMCGRAYSPRMLFMWPNARISVMGGEQAANTLLTVKLDQLKRAGRRP